MYFLGCLVRSQSWFYTYLGITDLYLVTNNPCFLLGLKLNWTLKSQTSLFFFFTSLIFCFPLDCWTSEISSTVLSKIGQSWISRHDM